MALLSTGGTMSLCLAASGPDIPGHCHGIHAYLQPLTVFESVLKGPENLAKLASSPRYHEVAVSCGSLASAQRQQQVPCNMERKGGSREFGVAAGGGWNCGRKGWVLPSALSSTVRTDPLLAVRAVLYIRGRPGNLYIQ